MLFFIKKFLFLGTFNFSLFLMLIIGIQNSSIKRKVNLIKWETVPLPISFICGVSLISGSIMGSLITFDFKKYKS